MEKSLLKIIILFSLPLFLGASCGITPERKISDGGVWFSNDGGYNWEQKIYVGPGELPDDPSDDILLDNTSVTMLKFHPLDSRIIYANTNNGIFFTENSGDQWEKIYEEAGISNFATDPSKRGVVYATKGNTVLKTDDNGENWRQIYIDSSPGAQIKAIAIDPLEPERVYIGTSIGNLIVSIDAGASWQRQEGFVAAVAEARMKQFDIVKILINPREREQIYVATQKQGMWVTFDRGTTWENLREYYKDYQNAADYRELVLDETRDGSLLYASAYGLLWTYDGGYNWSPLELLTDPNSINIRALAVNPNNPDEIYYANESVLYKSFNGGIEWIAENLPSSRPATSLLVDFFDGKQVYLGVEAPPKQKRGFIGF